MTMKMISLKRFPYSIKKPEKKETSPTIIMQGVQMIIK